MTLHIGLSFGRIEHWHDGVGEYTRQLALALAARAPTLLRDQGWQFHYHLPRQWHGLFGDAVAYLDTHTLQRFMHLRAKRFDLWHTLHQHIRLRAPLGTHYQVETVLDLNFLHSKSPAKAERYRRRLRARVSRRDAVAAISHYVAGDIARELAPVAKPVEVIHMGATDSTGIPREPVHGAPAVPFLLHISRMAPSKNVAALLALAASWPDKPMVLTGPRSPYTDALREQVDARGLSNVSMHLDVSDAQKAWLFAQCEGFVFPSFTEGFGMPPLEAMHFGKSVFLSRLTSLPEVGGTVAHYFDSFEGASMRATVEAGLAADTLPGRAQAIAAHARGFTWERCAQAHVALYLRVLQGAAVPTERP